MTSTAATATTDALDTENKVDRAASSRSLRNRVPGIRRSGSNDEGGFTLVEVMVVVLIIGILLAIGVPTFLGARNRAHDRAAQSSLRTAQNTALIIYTDNANFAEATVDAMSTAEPQVKWIKGTEKSGDPIEVSVTSKPTAVGAAAMSNSGTCFYIHVRSDGSTQYGSSTAKSCTGDIAIGVTGSGW